MNPTPTTKGGILLMVLVIMGMLTVMFIGSVGIVSRELHTTGDATQKERIYQVAESGVQRILFLVEQADYTLDQLVALSGSPQSISDPVTNAVVGLYTLTVVKQASGQAIDVLSIAKSPDERFCSKVSATIKSPSGSAAGPYFAYKWNRSVCPVDTVAPNPPTALPAGGIYNETKNVALSAEANATIYYTTDSTDPTTSSTVYTSTSPISISATVTLRAIAVDAAGNASSIMVEAYTIDTTPPAAPVASPPGGSYPSARSVTLSVTGEPTTTKIYYCTGASCTPSETSTQYVSSPNTPVAISSSTTLKAIAIDAAGNISPVMTEGYVISTIPATDKAWRSIAYGNGLFVAVAYDGVNRVMTSPDGITWTGRAASNPNSSWTSVTYGNGLFVAVAGASNGAMTSPDGITWTGRTLVENNYWHSVTYGNGLFVAVRNYAVNRVMTSPDGITWTFRPAAANLDWISVTYGNGLFVAVQSHSSLVPRVMTSPDGITWTGRTASSSFLTSVTYGNGLFVIVNATGNRVMTSPDGITWTSRTLANGNYWQSVTYGNGLFVAVAQTGTGNRVITSPDGIIWTFRASAADNEWRSVTYGNGLFVAVAQSGINNRIMTSPDGINWTSRPYTP